MNQFPMKIPTLRVPVLAGSWLFNSITKDIVGYLALRKLTT
jgi:hypothetical protein